MTGAFARGGVAGLVAAGVALGLACARPRLPERDVLALARRAEDARGLHFRETVDTRLLDPGEAQRLLASELDAAYPDDALARDARAAGWLGLLPTDTDLRGTILRFGGEAVVGFYAPVRRRLVVIGRAWPEAGAAARLELEGVVVHELAHALQDQHGDRIAAVLGLRGQDDLAFALGAFLEGEALFVEYADAEAAGGGARPPADELARRLGTRTAEAEYPDVPRAVREPFLLQYPLGYALVDALVAAGGTARLDAAALDPPLSSEQLLHPEKYLDPAQRELPLFLRLPADVAPDGCRELQRQSYGELSLRIWLRERAAARGGDPDAPEVAAAADGWAGDRAVAFACDDRGAFGWLVRFDTAPDAEEFAGSASRAVEGLQAAADLAGAARIERRGADVLVSAGLGRAARGRLLDEVQATVYPDLASFLAAHPEVLEEARRLRAGAARRR